MLTLYPIWKGYPDYRYIDDLMRKMIGKCSADEFEAAVDKALGFYSDDRWKIIIRGLSKLMNDPVKSEIIGRKITAAEEDDPILPFISACIKHNASDMERYSIGRESLMFYNLPSDAGDRITSEMIRSPEYWLMMTGAYKVIPELADTLMNEASPIYSTIVFTSAARYRDGDFLDNFMHGLSQETILSMMVFPDTLRWFFDHYGYRYASGLRSVHISSDSGTAEILQCLVKEHDMAKLVNNAFASCDSHYYSTDDFPKLTFIDTEELIFDPEDVNKGAVRYLEELAADGIEIYITKPDYGYSFAKGAPLYNAFTDKHPHFLIDSEVTEYLHPKKMGYLLSLDNVRFENEDFFTTAVRDIADHRSKLLFGKLIRTGAVNEKNVHEVMSYLIETKNFVCIREIYRLPELAKAAGEDIMSVQSENDVLFSSE